jgi:hypothetical protein
LPRDALSAYLTGCQASPNLIRWRQSRAALRQAHRRVRRTAPRRQRNDMLRRVAAALQLRYDSAGQDAFQGRGPTVLCSGWWHELAGNEGIPLFPQLTHRVSHRAGTVSPPCGHRADTVVSAVPHVPARSLHGGPHGPCTVTKDPSTLRVLPSWRVRRALDISVAELSTSPRTAPADARELASGPKTCGRRPLLHVLPPQHRPAAAEYSHEHEPLSRSEPEGEPDVSRKKTTPHILSDLHLSRMSQMSRMKSKNSP